MVHNSTATKEIAWSRLWRWRCCGAVCAPCGRWRYVRHVEDAGHLQPGGADRLGVAVDQRGVGQHVVLRVLCVVQTANVGRQSAGGGSSCDVPNWSVRWWYILRDQRDGAPPSNLPTCHLFVFVHSPRPQTCSAQPASSMTSDGGLSGAVYASRNTVPIVAPAMSATCTPEPGGSACCYWNGYGGSATTRPKEDGSRSRRTRGSSSAWTARRHRRPRRTAGRRTHRRRRRRHRRRPPFHRQHRRRRARAASCRRSRESPRGARTESPRGARPSAGRPPVNIDSDDC